MVELSLFKGACMSDVNVPATIESRLDSTDVIRESLINTIYTEAEESLVKLVANDKLMVALTTLLRDRDSTNSKRLRINADKEMAKRNGEEAREIMEMVLERNRANKLKAETNPEEHAAKRELDRNLLPEVTVTEDMVKVGTSNLTYDGFVLEYEKERGIENKT